jgi:hypothetical protein
MPVIGWTRLMALRSGMGRSSEAMAGRAMIVAKKKTTDFMAWRVSERPDQTGGIYFKARGGKL